MHVILKSLIYSYVLSFYIYIVLSRQSLRKKTNLKRVRAKKLQLQLVVTKLLLEIKLHYLKVGQNKQLTKEKHISSMPKLEKVCGNVQSLRPQMKRQEVKRQQMRKKLKNPRKRKKVNSFFLLNSLFHIYGNL